MSFSLLKVVGVLASAFSVTYSSFIVGRVLVGFASFGVNLAAFVLGNSNVSQLRLRTDVYRPEPCTNQSKLYSIRCVANSRLAHSRRSYFWGI